MDTPERGFESTLYVNTATFGAPTWTEIDLARDLKSLRDQAELKTTTRGTARRGFEAAVAGITPAGWEFEMLKPAAGESNDAYTALIAALKARTSVDLLHVDGGDIDQDGLPATRIVCCVTGGGEGEPISDVTTVSLKCQFTQNADQEAPEEGVTSGGDLIAGS
jgi:hypothetical protein